MKVRRKGWEVGKSEVGKALGARALVVIVVRLMEVHVLVAQLEVVAHAREVLALLTPVLVPGLVLVGAAALGMVMLLALWTHQPRSPICQLSVRPAPNVRRCLAQCWFGFAELVAPTDLQRKWMPHSPALPLPSEPLQKGTQHT